MANKTLIRKWIKALNSGDYNESHNDSICTKDPKTKQHCFCAFGVLLDILPKEKFDWTGKFFQELYNKKFLAEYKIGGNISNDNREALYFAARELDITFNEALSLSNLYEGIDFSVYPHPEKLSYKQFAKHLKETYLNNVK